MTAALALPIMLEKSLTPVQISGTISRLICVPLDLAFLQSISTGTGKWFTAQKPEPPVARNLRLPARDRVLVCRASTALLAFTATTAPR